MEDIMLKYKGKRLPTIKIQNLIASKGVGVWVTAFRNGDWREFHNLLEIKASGGGLWRIYEFAYHPSYWGCQHQNTMEATNTNLQICPFELAQVLDEVRGEVEARYESLGDHHITHERLTDQEYMKIMDVLESDDFKDPWEGGKE
jgi:hypothetical protein